MFSFQKKIIIHIYFNIKMFIPTKFRTCSDTESLRDSFKKFANKNYSSSTFDSISNFVNELLQTRNVIGNFSPKGASIESINGIIVKCLTYIKVLDIVSMKIKLGKDDESLNLKFSWKDVTTGKVNSSQNILVEICSAKFNLATCYCLLGYSKVKSTNAELLRESVKNFEKAAYIFTEIKTTVEKNALAKENIPDLAESYIESLINYTLGMAQICVCTIVEIKAYSGLLRAKLAMGASVFFTKIANTTLSFKPDKTLVNYYVLYYNILALDAMRQYYVGEYEKVGKGIGIAIGYARYAQELFEQCEKIIKNVRQYINEPAYQKLKGELEVFVTIKSAENLKIYMEPELKAQDLPKIDAEVNKVSPIAPTEKANLFNSISELNNLVSPEVKPLINKYISEMRNYIFSRLDQYENEKSIDTFLNLKNLPMALSTGICTCPLSDSIFSGFQVIQSKGGLMYLTDSVKQINQESAKAEEILRGLVTKMEVEVEEDTKNAIMYGNKWTCRINREYIDKLNLFKEKLATAKKMDSELRWRIADNSKYYELVGLPRNIIEARIPSNSDPAKLAELPSTKALKFAIDKLMSDKNLIKEQIETMMNELNMNVPITELQKVVKGVRNERLVIEDGKKKIEKYFVKISEIDKIIKNDFSDIELKFSEFSKACQEMGSGEEGRKYIEFLNNAEHEFSRAIANIGNSLNFYNQYFEHIKKFSDDLMSYFLARNITKEELIEQLLHDERFRLAQNSIRNSKNKKSNNNQGGGFGGNRYANKKYN